MVAVCRGDYLLHCVQYPAIASSHVHRSRPQPSLPARRAPARALPRRRQGRDTYPRQLVEVASRPRRGPRDPARGRHRRRPFGVSTSRYDSMRITPPRLLRRTLPAFDQTPFLVAQGTGPASVPPASRSGNVAGPAPCAPSAILILALGFTVRPLALRLPGRRRAKSTPEPVPKNGLTGKTRIAGAPWPLPDLASIVPAESFARIHTCVRRGGARTGEEFQWPASKSTDEV